jgi:hypothetical protein
MEELTMVRPRRQGAGETSLSALVTDWAMETWYDPSIA